MSLWSRIANVLRPERLNREIDEELHSHLEEAARQGRDPAEARVAFGPTLRYAEISRDLRLLPWLDSLRADAVFGWRQLVRKKSASAAAVLSLALAIGACTATFRIVDALLFRPLPVASSARLYAVAFEGAGPAGKVMTYDSSSYPMFRRMRAAVSSQAESMAVSYVDRLDLTYASDQEMEKAHWQYVSGWMFGALGLQPAAGRLLTAADDDVPGARPVAVLSFDYWTRRFANDPRAIGRSFRVGNDIFQIVGVSAEGFTGTENGTVTDIFVPMAMKNLDSLESYNNFWLRTLVQLKPGIHAQPVREQLRAVFQAIQQERARGFTGMSRQRLEAYFKEKMILEPAPSGRSNLQRDYRRPLLALSILVALVLLIACANVANLMTARAASRAREMALRVSIGAGRWRLVQLVLVESAWLAALATVTGAWLAWWSAPAIVGMINPPGDPARLLLPADFRVFAFTGTLALAVTLLFGLLPALRASAVQPVSALKGGEDPHSRRRLMHALIALQIAFCFVVHFVAVLFVGTLDRLSNQPTGFSAARIVNLETVTTRPQSPLFWEQVAQDLRSSAGVESVAMLGWPLMSGESWTGDVSIGGAPPNDVFCDFFRVSPAMMDTLRIPFIDGRDFRAVDSDPGSAIVNSAFARQYFDGANPVGKSFDRVDAGVRRRFEIVGFVRDAYIRDNPRLPVRPTVYVPFRSLGAAGTFEPFARATFAVRTSNPNPLVLASALRRRVQDSRPGFRVSNIRAQAEINRSLTLRERLLATLALFFAAVALLLAGLGLYGVLDYLVVQQRREIGIRIAIGAPAPSIARLVTFNIFLVVALGSLAGAGLGLAASRYLQALLYQVKPGDPAMLALPACMILAAALLAAIPAVVRALRIDPVTMLRVD